MLPENETLTRELAALLEAYGYEFDPCEGIGLPTVADVGYSLFLTGSRGDAASSYQVFVANAGTVLDPDQWFTENPKGVGYQAHLTTTGRVLITRYVDGEFSPKRPFKATSVVELKAILDRLGVIPKPANRSVSYPFDQLCPASWFTPTPPPTVVEGVVKGDFEPFWLYEVRNSAGEALATLTCRKAEYDLRNAVEEGKLPVALRRSLKPFLTTAFAVHAKRFEYFYTPDTPESYVVDPKPFLVYSPGAGVVDPIAAERGLTYSVQGAFGGYTAPVKMDVNALRSYIAANKTLPEAFSKFPKCAGKLYLLRGRKREVIAQVTDEAVELV